MSPEEHELLKRSIALSEENNDILRGIQRTMRFNRFMTAIYWLIIIGVSVGAWYFVQPYWSKAKGFYNNAEIQLNSISTAAGNVGNTAAGAANSAGGVVNDIGNFINTIKQKISQ